jgi:hypothetical protein
MKYIYLIAFVAFIVYSVKYNSETFVIIGLVFLCTYSILDEISKLKSE